MMATPSCGVLMILAERYIEFHNAVNRAASYQEGVYPFHDELDILFQLR